jgi:hypothetical protein
VLFQGRKFDLAMLFFTIIDIRGAVEGFVSGRAKMKSLVLSGSLPKWMQIASALESEIERLVIRGALRLRRQPSPACCYVAPIMIGKATSNNNVEHDVDHLRHALSQTVLEFTRLTKSVEMK